MSNPNDRPSQPENAPEAQPANDSPEQSSVATRRSVLLGGLAAAGAAVALGAANAANAQDVKSRILSRIQEEIQRDHLEDPMDYDRGVIVHEKYSKKDGGSGGSGGSS